MLSCSSSLRVAGGEPIPWHSDVVAMATSGGLLYAATRSGAVYGHTLGGVEVAAYGTLPTPVVDMAACGEARSASFGPRCFGTR